MDNRCRDDVPPLKAAQPGHRRSTRDPDQRATPRHAQLQEAPDWPLEKALPGPAGWPARGRARTRSTLRNSAAQHNVAGAEPGPGLLPIAVCAG